MKWNEMKWNEIFNDDLNDNGVGLRGMNQRGSAVQWGGWHPLEGRAVMGSIPAKFNDLVTWATGSAAASATSPISYSSGCASASISSAGSDPSVGQTNKQGWLNSASSEPVATLDGAIAPSMRLKSSFQSDHPSGGETETATETHSETGAETQPESNRNPTGIQPESNRNPTLNQTQDWKNYTQTEIVTIISRWNRQSLFMGSNRIEQDRTGSSGIERDRTGSNGIELESNPNQLL